MATPNIVPRADSEGGIGTSSKYWASAYIDLIYVGAGKVGRDADNYLDFSTDNEIQFRVNGNHEIIFNANQIHPTSDDGIALGYAGRGFSDLFLASGAVINFDSGNVTLTHSTDALAIADGMQFRIGSGNDLRLYHSTDSYISNEGNGHLNIRNLVDDADVILSCDDGSGGSTAYITLDGSTNRVNFAKPIKMADDTAINLGAGLDLRIFHESGSTSKIENYTGNLTIQQRADDADIVFQCDDGSGSLTEYLRLDGSTTSMQASKNIVFADSIRSVFGGGADLAIYHNGTTNNIEAVNGTLRLIQSQDDADITFESDDGAGGITTYFQLDGSSATHSGSATTGLYTNWPDYSRISLGTGHDMLMYHDGTQTVYQNRVGNFYITQAADDLDIIFQCDDGSGGTTPYITLDGSAEKINLYKSIEFTGGGFDFGDDGSGADASFYGDTSGRLMKWDASDNSLIFNDNTFAKFGNGGDMQLSHDGSNSKITNMVGNLSIINYADDSDIIFETDNGSGGTTEYFKLDGSTADGTFRYTIFPDSSMISMGNSNDLIIGHNATNSSIINYNGNLEIGNAADDGDVIFTCDDGSGGTETYFFLDGSESVVTFLDDKRLTFGTGRDLYLYHTGSEAQMKNYTGQLTFSQEVNDGDIVFKSDDGSGGTAAYLTIDGSAHVTVANKHILFPDTKRAYFGDGYDFEIYHDSSNSYISQGGTGDLYIRQTTDDKDILFYCDDGSGGTAEYLRLDGSTTNILASQNINLIDDKAVLFGTGSDAFFKHTGSQFSFFNDTGPVIFYQRVDDGYIAFQSDDGSGGLTEYFRVDGQNEIVKFSKDSRHNDSVKANFGTGNDLQIYHDGSNSYIRQDGTGDLIIQTLVDDRDIIFGSDDGSGGTANYMAIDGSIARVNFYKNTLHGDGVQAAWGSNVDLRVEHDGTDSTITNTEGNLNFYQNADDGDIRFYNDNGSGGTTEYFRLDGGDSSTQIKTIKVLMPNLPTSDPSTAGQLWNDSGTLKISAG